MADVVLGGDGDDTNQRPTTAIRWTGGERGDVINAIAMIDWKDTGDRDRFSTLRRPVLLTCQETPRIARQLRPGDGKMLEIRAAAMAPDSRACGHGKCPW